MPKEKLPEKLNVFPLPLGSDEMEANRLAIQYNSLKPNDTKRGEILAQYKTACSRAKWD